MHSCRQNIGRCLADCKRVADRPQGILTMQLMGLTERYLVENDRFISSVTKVEIIKTQKLHFHLVLKSTQQLHSIRSGIACRNWSGCERHRLMTTRR